MTICPDIDLVVYALAGLNDTTRGWGVADETMAGDGHAARVGAPDWFNLGDRDLGMHLARSARLRAGECLSEATEALTRALGITHKVVPMSDAPVRTQVETDSRLARFPALVRARAMPARSARHPLCRASRRAVAGPG